MERELKAGCLLVPWICLPCRAALSWAQARKPQAFIASTFTHRNSLRWKSWVTPDCCQPGPAWLPTWCQPGSIYSALHSPPNGLTRCRLAPDVVFLEHQASFTQCWLLEVFSHRRWQIRLSLPSSTTPHFPRPQTLYIYGTNLLQICRRQNSTYNTCLLLAITEFLQAALLSGRPPRQQSTFVMSTITIFQDIFSQASK